MLHIGAKLVSYLTDPAEYSWSGRRHAGITGTYGRSRLANGTLKSTGTRRTLEKTEDRCTMSNVNINPSVANEQSYGKCHLIKMEDFSEWSTWWQHTDIKSIELRKLAIYTLALPCKETACKSHWNRGEGGCVTLCLWVMKGYQFKS